ncbi:MAG: 1-(5-phosphoribosyl)-5-[(5-phosphoribosylamino)methylideneamino]imidazole-4-carboxamide isomerase [Candidatus Omnitrophota bacterium]
MIPIPAIDLKGGKVVRLLQGQFKEEKVYFQDPGEIAERFEKEGAERIHVVDLDGALGGMPKNVDCVRKILSCVRAPLEVGGGVRELKTAKAYLEMGARWVILGTKACLDKGFVKEALGEFGEKIIIGIDALEGYVATDAWTKVTRTKALDLAREVEERGAKTVVYTDISKDGMMLGPSISQIKALSEAVRMDVIASGGIGELSDLSRIMDLKQKNIIGAIIGKALYENKFSLTEAVRLCSQNG